MKRNKGVGRVGKKQKVSELLYVPGAAKQSKKLERLRVISWTDTDEQIIENRNSILGMLEEFTCTWEYDVLKDLSFVKLLIYDVYDQWENKPFDSEILKTLDSKIPILTGPNGERALLVGIAVVVPWMEEQVHKLIHFEVQWDGSNIPQYFYDTLKTQYRNIVLARRSTDFKLEKLKLLGVLNDTKTIWQPRDPYRLNLGCNDEVIFKKNINRVDLANFYEDLGGLFAQSRNWLLAYLRVALDCDGPILEAVSHAWPESLYPITLGRVEGGVEFVFSWELSEKTNQVGRRYKTVYRASMGNTNIQLRFGGWIAFDGPPDETVYAINTTTTIDLRNEDRFQSVIPLLPSLFQKHGIVLRGSIFGSYYGLD